MGGVEVKVQELLANAGPAIPAGGNGVTREEVASLVKTELMQRISPQTLQSIVDSRIRQILATLAPGIINEHANTRKQLKKTQEQAAQAQREADEAL